MMKRILTLGVMLLAYGSVQASTYIDTFNDTTPQVVSADGSSTVATSSAIGGYRKIGITKTGLQGALAAVVTGVFTQSSDALTSATSTITWDANGAGLGLNLLAQDTLGFTGSTCFQCFVIDVIDIDQGNVDLTFELTDSFNNSASYTATSVLNGINEIAFSQFNNGIDLTAINSIALIVAGGMASDLVLNFEGFTGTQASGSPVPEPYTLVLLILGAVMLVFRKYDSKEV